MRAKEQEYISSFTRDKRESVEALTTKHTSLVASLKTDHKRVLEALNAELARTKQQLERQQKEREAQLERGRLAMQDLDKTLDLDSEANGDGDGDDSSEAGESANKNNGEMAQRFKARAEALRVALVEAQEQVAALEMEMTARDEENAQVLKNIIMAKEAEFADVLHTALHTKQPIPGDDDEQDQGGMLQGGGSLQGASSDDDGAGRNSGTLYNSEKQQQRDSATNKRKNKNKEGGGRNSTSGSRRTPSPGYVGADGNLGAPGSGGGSGAKRRTSSTIRGSRYQRMSPTTRQVLQDTVKHTTTATVASEMVREAISAGSANIRKERGLSGQDGVGAEGGVGSLLAQQQEDDDDSVFSPGSLRKLSVFFGVEEEVMPTKQEPAAQNSKAEDGSMQEKETGEDEGSMLDKISSFFGDV